MSSKLIRSKLNDVDHYSLVDCTNGNLFSFFPSLGCCLNQLEFSGKKILRCADSDNLDEMIEQANNGAQLFPFPNRLANGTYSWNGEKYDFELNDPGKSNALHGILTKKKFSMMASQPEGVVAMKYEYRNDHLGYPFDIDIINEFRLGSNFLEIKTVIKNVGSEDAPVAHGWHPYFHGSSSIDNCKITIPRSVQLVVDQNMIPTGDSYVYDEFAENKLIEQASFDSCFKKMEGAIELRNNEEKYALLISSKGYPFTQIFIPPSRDSIAIEPQTCAPDAFNNQQGLIKLNALEAKSFHFRIERIE